MTTELSPAFVAVQNAVRLPVRDYTTLTKWIYLSCVRRHSVGRTYGQTEEIYNPSPISS